MQNIINFIHKAEVILLLIHHSPLWGRDLKVLFLLLKHKGVVFFFFIK